MAVEETDEAEQNCAERHPSNKQVGFCAVAISAVAAQLMAKHPYIQ